MEVGKSESSQTDKNDNINIIADDNESNSKGNPSIISDYNIFNGASNNYNNIFNHSFDSDTSNNSFHSVKTPHPYMKSKSSSNNFIYNEQEQTHTYRIRIWLKENVDMSKYIALLIDALNHDASISEYLNPANRIQRILKKYNK